MRFLRRRIYLSRPFQLSLIGFQAIYFAILAAALFFCFVEPLLSAVQDGDASAAERSGSALALLHFDRRALPVLVPLLFVLFVHSILVSHRIAGPLYRFGVVLRGIVGGDLSQRFRIRPGDYMHEEAELLQLTIDTLRARFEAIRADSRALTKALDGVQATPQVRAAAEGLRANLEGLVLEPEPRAEPERESARKAA